MPFRSKIVGAWELVSFVSINEHDPDDIKFPMGKDCKGLIMYTPDGYMSAHINRSDKPLYSHGALQGTKDEFAQIAAESLAYSGPYYLKELEHEGDEPHQLYHLPSVGIGRNWINNLQARPARVVEEDGQMMLCLEGKAVKNSEGVSRYSRIKWRRMKDNSQGVLPDGSS